MEDPRFAKKLVKRELTRVVTPGTATEPGLLRSHENNFLAAVFASGARAGLAYVDVSTGEFRATELDAAEVPATLEQLGAREVLCPAETALPPARYLRTEVEGWVFGFDHAERSLKEHYKLLALDGCGLAGTAAWPWARPARCCTTSRTPRNPPSATSTRRSTSSAPTP